jgi:hypothetical protein
MVERKKIKRAGSVRAPGPISTKNKHLLEVL